MKGTRTQSIGGVAVDSGKDKTQGHCATKYSDVLDYAQSKTFNLT